jgi:triosephosphate isomerase
MDRPMGKNIIAGNWKMFKTNSEALRLVKQLKTKLNKKKTNKTLVIVCPPFTALSAVSQELKGSKIDVGAQNIFVREEGAFTGEISPGMVKGAGAKYVIIGHSERRRYFKEDEKLVNQKIKLALKYKLKVIFCVGETLEERKQNLTQDIIANQLEWGLKGIRVPELKNVFIAYEPVWAIGTGKTATPKQAQEAHAFLRVVIDALYTDGIGKQMSILYGGSVKPDNALGLLSQKDIDGALVGGACLVASDFWKIIQASERVG